MAQPADFERMTCPIARAGDERVLLGHGSGGKLSAELIERVFISQFGNQTPAALEDSAAFSAEKESSDRRLVITTDSYVVKPLFFPGGDIGKLAVNGTVNDLAVSGATPLVLSAAFILEEGLEIESLRRIVASMRQACDVAGVELVTGDTKVVDRGKGDQVFITTTGVGFRALDCELSIQNAKPGDQILVSGTIGDHGVAIMSTREGIEFETALESDTAALNGLTRAMLAACPSVRLMRDPTRGGIAGTLNELAIGSGVGAVVEESSIPVRPEVQSACEMLGFDPLFVANEGKLVAVVPQPDAKRMLDVMRNHPLGRDAAMIGHVTDDHAGMVVMRTLIGGQRVVTMLAGEQLPRIC